MQEVAAQAAMFSQSALSNQIVLVNGNVGVVSRQPDMGACSPSSLSRLLTAGSWRWTLADPERITRLDLSAIDS